LITDALFEALDLKQLGTTTLTFTWTNTQVYPEDLTLLIEYDKNEFRPDIAEGQNTVPCIFSRTFFVTCEYIENSNSDSGLIKVMDLLMTD